MTPLNEPEIGGERQVELRRNVTLFGLTSLCNDTATEMAYWIVPAFLTAIGAGPAQLGIIEGVAESVASFTKLFSGLLADRTVRRKPLVVAGYAISNVAKPFLALATRWWHVLGVRFADRLSKGIRSAPRDVMLAESTSKGKLGAAFGLLQAMDSAGAVLGPLVAIIVLSRFTGAGGELSGYRQVFWLAAIPGALSILTVLRVRERAGGGRRAKTIVTSGAEAELSAPTGAVAHTRIATPPTRLPTSFFWVMIAVGIFSLGNSSDMFLVLRAQDAGISAAYAPLLGLVFNLTYTVASWPFGKLADRTPKRWLAAAGYLVFAATYFAFAQAPSRAVIWGAMAFYGLFYALTNPVLRALVAETVAPEARGRAFGVFYFVISVAALASSIATGQLWKTYGAALAFELSAALAVAAAAMLMLRSGRAVKAKTQARR